MDLTATFTTLACAQPEPDQPLDGIDLMHILTGQQPESTRNPCWRIDRVGRQQKAVRHGNWKYIQDGNVEMLFDLATDISERSDRSYQQPSLFRELKDRLAAWEAELAKEETTFLIK